MSKADLHGLPASWVSFLLAQKEGVMRQMLPQTYAYLYRERLDGLSLRFFEVVIDAFGVAGLEMEVDEALNFLKFAKVGALKAQDLKMAL